MILPFVSRGRYDDMVASRDGWKAEHALLWQQHIKLTDDLLRMKQEGFTAQPDYVNQYIEPPLTTDEADALKVEIEQFDG